MLGYMKRYRYCEYLGKYFCPRCHSDEVHIIPGHILARWDFTQYSVSNFSKELLVRISTEPLFSIDALNPGLYKKVKVLEQMRDYRQQLGHIMVLLRTCRFSQS